MKTMLQQIVSLVVLAAGMVGCADSSDDNSTNLRFFNAVAGVASVDVLVDSDEYLDGVGYLESTDYLEFDTNPHIFQVTPSNSLTAIDTQRVSLRDDVDYTYIACGNSSEPEAILLEDDTEPAGDGAFKARIINVFKGARGFDVYVTANADGIDDTQPTARRLGFKGTTSYRVARAGTYDIVVRNTTTGTIAATSIGQDFHEENVYSIMLVAEEDDPSRVQVLVLTDRDVS
jgi:hypothetical protein